MKTGEIYFIGIIPIYILYVGACITRVEAEGEVFTLDNGVLKGELGIK